MADTDTVRVPVVVTGWPDTLDLGFPFTLAVDLCHPALESIGLVTAEDALAPFELVSWRRGLDRGDTASVSLELRAFRVGELVMPPLVFAASISDGGLAVGWTDSLRVTVRSVVPADAEDILDIHGPVALANPRPWWPYVVGALVLAAVLALILARRRRRIEGSDRLTAARPAHDVALSALARLGEREEARSGPWKIYYSELADILRRYLARRFGVEASDMTTSETLRAVSGLRLPDDAVGALRAILEEADAVKFARAEPAPGAPPDHLRDGERFVQLTQTEVAPPSSEPALAGASSGGAP